MSDNAAELKVAITTTADTSGVVAQTEAFKELDLTAGKTANRIQVALAKQEVAEKAATSESRSAQQEAAQSALREIDAREKAAKAAKGAADASKQLSGELRGLQQAGQGANNVLQGLSQGGIGGLIQAGRGAIGMFRSLATSALGAPLLAALATVGSAMYALRVIVRDAQKEIQRETDKGVASMKRMEAAYAATKAAAEASLKAQLENVEKLTSAWSELDGAIGRAQARAEKKTASQNATEDAKTNLAEQQALAAAQTPEERDSIQRRFAGVRTDQKNRRASQALDTEELQAGVTESAAQQKIIDSNAAIRDAESRVRDKEAVFQRSKDLADQLPLGSDAKAEARGQAKVAQSALEKEREALAEVIKKMAADIAAANEKIEAARDTRAEVAERRKGLALQTGADATQRANESLQRVDEAGRPVAELASRRDQSAQRLKGLESQKDRETELGGKKETLAAIEEAKAQLAKDDAELAEAQKAYAAAAKEAAAAQLKQTTEQRNAAAAAAQKQLAAQEGYHGSVVDGMRALQEQLDRQSKEIATLKRSRKATADSAQ